MNLGDLREYHKNPRKISDERFAQLGDSLRELGDLGGIVVNRPTKEVIGGNQRTKGFLQDRDSYEIVIEKEFHEKQTDGTVAYGYIIRKENGEEVQRFSYREVEWDDKTCERANIVANKLTGFWDFEILANQFELDDLLTFGFTESDLGLLPKDEVQIDQDGLKKSSDTKQMILYFKTDEFDSVCSRLDRVMADTGTESHTDVVLALLSEHEENNSQENASLS